MTSTSDADIILSLENISVQLNRYLSPTIFIFGVVGNALNCLLLSQRTLRTNPCALLFLVSSFVALISILVGVPFRILAGWQLDVTTHVTWICRLRAFVVFSMRTMALWLIMFATVDRWLLSSTHAHRRQMSSLKNTIIQISFSFVLSIAAYGHMIDCYEANLHDEPLKCYGKTEACRLATDLVYVLITIGTPLIMMVTFGLLTISNVRQVHMRVQHGADDHAHGERLHAHSRKVDRHLLRMLLVQVLFLIVLCLPQAIQKLHITVRPFHSGSELEDAVKTFLYNIEILLAFIASSMPFYIYVLTSGSMFRKALLNWIRTMRRTLN